MTNAEGPSVPLTTVGACQVAIDIDDPTATRAALDAAVGSAVRAGAQLVVLPELAVCGGAFSTSAEAAQRSEPDDGPSVSWYCELSRRYGMVLVAGFCERGPDRPYNSAVLVDHGRILTVYRKTHLWGIEKEIFRPGDAPPPVVGASLGRIGVVICYDLEIPEVSRSLALRGAQLIAAPANWPLLPRPAGERPAEVFKAQTAAAVNRTFVVVADRCGVERGQDWIGGSVICGLDGYPLAAPVYGEPTVLLAEVDLEAALDKSFGPYNDVFADRRTELYGDGC
ncbi:MAG TPA: nitrilase-related carbon-nitrogen hydrolase [Propionibacteriaceae bacterium]|nr:nitrilase-related carbon-nitrogen hydrolase [Propionibacteriaceae bacterium]